MQKPVHILPTTNNLNAESLALEFGKTIDSLERFAALNFTALDPVEFARL
mgnify:CR=1 FL=1